jgi:hypothetical protein
MTEAIELEIHCVGIENDFWIFFGASTARVVFRQVLNPAPLPLCPSRTPRTPAYKPQFPY